MIPLAENLWTLSFPLQVLGTQHGRTVTIVRLASGKLVIHSMAPFLPDHLAQIRQCGDPGWLVEAMLLHDTYAAEGRKSFPDLPFLGPPGFGEVAGFPVADVLPAPAEWGDELEVIALEGIPRLKEHLFFHRPSRTLIVADLIFNFDPAERGWERWFHRHLAGFRRYPGISRIFRWCIADREAFRASLARLDAWDFDRIIPGHGRVIESGGKAALRQALQDTLA